MFTAASVAPAAARELVLPYSSTVRRFVRARMKIALLLVACLLPSQSCVQREPAAVSADTVPVTLTIGYPHVTGQDPLHGMQQGARLISHEGLVLANRNGRIHPRLAESWQEEPNGLIWHFRLRENAVFHDGSPVDAMAVKASLERSLANADTDSFPGLADIIGIDAPSRTQLVVRLRHRSAFLLDDLGVAIQKASVTGSAVGTGPYITASTSQNEVVMTSFSRYYKGPPKIDRIVWKSYPAVRAAWAAMMRGDVDLLYEVGPETLEFMRGASVEVYPFLRSYLFGIILKVDRRDLSDPRVRASMNYAIDRSQLVSQVLKQHGIPATGLAWPQHWAYDSSVPSFSYDPQRATALLDAAGVAALSPASSERPPSRLRFTCLVPEGFALWERMALMAQRNLSHIGIDMELESLPFVAFNQRIAKRDFEAVMMEFVIGSSPSRLFTFWYSEGKRNAWGYKNARMDQALNGIRRAANDEEYRHAFRQFQIQAFDDPPAIVLALAENARAVSRRFRVVAPPGSDILPTIGDWLPIDDTAETN